jgi:hypothetical protein
VGVVAFGIAFSDGHVVLRWCSSHPATSTWGSLEDMLAVHGRGEATSIQWIDAPATELEDAPGVGRSATLPPTTSPRPATLAWPPSPRVLRPRPVAAPGW